MSGEAIPNSKSFNTEEAPQTVGLIEGDEAGEADRLAVEQLFSNNPKATVAALRRLLESPDLSVTASSGEGEDMHVETWDTEGDKNPLARILNNDKATIRGLLKNNGVTNPDILTEQSMALDLLLRDPRLQVTARSGEEHYPWSAEGNNPLAKVLDGDPQATYNVLIN